MKTVRPDWVVPVTGPLSMAMVGAERAGMDALTPQARSASQSRCLMPNLSMRWNVRSGEGKGGLRGAV